MLNYIQSRLLLSILQGAFILLTSQMRTPSVGDGKRLFPKLQNRWVLEGKKSNPSPLILQSILFSLPFTAFHNSYSLNLLITLFMTHCDPNQPALYLFLYGLLLSTRWYPLQGQGPSSLLSS